MSPYFTGFILSCGIPKIEVQGTVEDYGKLKEACLVLMKHFGDDPKIVGFFGTVAKHAQDLGDFLADHNNGRFLESFFEVNNCASGHPVWEVCGWFTDLVTMSGRKEAMLKDSCYKASLVKFDMEEHPDKQIACVAGVFNSTYDEKNNILVPQFDHYWVVYNKKVE